MLEITRPDDWHVHFRDGDALADTVPPVARVFGRAVAMPNLAPPVRTSAEALAYAARLRAHSPRAAFEPLPSLYLTDRTRPDEILGARAAGLVAAKLYPAGATTHSDAGVTDIRALDPVFEAMAACGLVLELHGELADPACDVFEREARFVETVLGPLCARHPRLKVILEHVTSALGVAFVMSAGEQVAATVTAHHLEVERSDLFRGGLRPHLFCLPVPKAKADRDAVLGAALSGHPRFFLGSDSAPHPRARKESACCPAGVYTGHQAILHYAEIFERHGALARLEPFASHFGADFYGLPRNPDSIVLERRPTPVSAVLPLARDEVVPYRAGETLAWSVARC
jgi:dihydroorotase